MGGDDPHTSYLPPGNSRHLLGDLVRQLGRDVAKSADDRFSGQAQRALGVPAFLAERYKLGCGVGCFGEVSEEVVNSLVKDLRPRRGCGRPGA
jgi:hypothetical protein